MARSRRKTRSRTVADVPLGPADAVAFAALALAALLARLFLLNDGLFHHDAVRLAQAVEESARIGSLTPLQLHDPPVSGRYGLVAVNWGLQSIAGPALGWSTERTLLVSAALFGSMAVGMCHLLARLSGLPRSVSVAAAGLLACTPIVFAETVGAKGHGLALFALLAGLVLSALAARRGSVPLAVAAGLWIGGSGLVRMPVLLALAPGALMFFTHGRHRIPAIVGYAAGAAVAIALVLALQWEWITRFSSITGYRLWEPGIVRVAAADVNASFTPIGIAAFVAGVVAAVRERRLWALVALSVVGFLYAANLEQYSARFLIEPLAAACILIAAGGHLALGRWRWGYAAAMAVVCVVPLVRAFPVISYRHDRIGNKEVARVLAERTPANAIVIAMDDAPFIQYYAKRRTLGHPIGDPSRPDASREEARAFVRRVYDLACSGTPVYLIKSGLAYDPGQLVNRGLGAVFSLEEVARLESEDYHHNSIRSGRYEQIVWRLVPKVPGGGDDAR